MSYNHIMSNFDNEEFYTPLTLCLYSRIQFEKIKSAIFGVHKVSSVGEKKLVTFQEFVFRLKMCHT